MPKLFFYNNNLLRKKFGQSFYKINWSQCISITYIQDSDIYICLQFILLRYLKAQPYLSRITMKSKLGDSFLCVINFNMGHFPLLSLATNDLKLTSRLLTIGYSIPQIFPVGRELFRSDQLHSHNRVIHDVHKVENNYGTIMSVLNLGTKYQLEVCVHKIFCKWALAAECISSTYQALLPDLALAKWQVLAIVGQLLWPHRRQHRQFDCVTVVSLLMLFPQDCYVPSKLMNWIEFCMEFVLVLCVQLHFQQPFPHYLWDMTNLILLFLSCKPCFSSSKLRKWMCFSSSNWSLYRDTT